MIKKISLYFLAGILLLAYSCIKDLEDDPQYARPGWLAGKVYSQIEAQPELSQFAQAVKKVGLDSIINISGIYTVFAPSNDAFDAYFQIHPVYKSINDIPEDELLQIVQNHIIKNPWSMEQLKQLDVYGWIDTTDENNNKPRGFKRETLLRDLDTKYGVTKNYAENYFSIVDTLNSIWHRRKATDANKFASIFHKKYLDIYNLKSDDYEFYFNRPFEKATDMYYLNGKIIKGDIFAENGFVHIIDKVTEPLKNAYQILNTTKDNISYSKFLDLINTFPSFTYNRDKTLAQPGAKEGNVVDSLFDINYYDLAFDIINENTKPPKGTYGLPGNVTIRYQNGLVAPTNEALQAFEAEYLLGGTSWGGIMKAPKFIRRIIVNSCMSAGTPVYPTNLQKGFLNGENDFMKLDLSTIVQKQYGSNCAVIGVNKAIVPRVFKSIAGPVYLNRGYSFAMYCIQRAGLLAALKTENVQYSLFVESDNNCKIDSSLIYQASTINGNIFETYTAWQKQGNQWTGYNLSVADLRTFLLNHIGTDIPRGIGRKEFIRNLAGNYIIVNNQTGELSGTAATTFGFKNTKVVQVVPTQISTASVDNGKTYDISNWFNFTTSNLYVRISSNPDLTKFHALLVKAGLADTNGQKYNFLSDNEFYTVLAPTNTALTNYQADTIPKDRLQKFLRMHFIQGKMIFTDGKLPSGYYETTRIDEKSTPYTTIFTKIYIQPEVDLIHVKDKLGNNYISVSESATTNLITGRNLSVGNVTFPEYVSTGVIHFVDKVLLYSDIDTQ